MVVSYTAGGMHFLLKLFQMKGSVFPRAFTFALPCAIASAVLKVLIDRGYIPCLEGPNSILSDTQAFAGFSFLVGFLIVFRTSQGYNRFWDGCSATHQMRAEWFDAAAALVAFCKHSDVAQHMIEEFKHTLVRLFSMLHATALAELEEVNLADDSGLQSFDFDLVDPGSIDEDSLKALKFSTSKVELTFFWIQSLIVDHMRTGVLSIPPPILSRAFQEIANGMVAFHNAMKITFVPFPFPYAQTCDFLLCLHWLVVPLVTTQWVTEPAWAAIFVFIQVFILWALNLIAVEIENPFGQDPNDLNGRHMQIEMNRHLVLLLQPETYRTPYLVGDGKAACTEEVQELEVQSFNQVWKDMDGEAVSRTVRTAVFRNADVKRLSKTEEQVSGRRSINPHRLSFAQLPQKGRVHPHQNGLHSDGGSQLASGQSSLVSIEIGDKLETCTAKDRHISKESSDGFFVSPQPTDNRGSVRSDARSVHSDAVGAAASGGTGGTEPRDGTRSPAPDVIGAVTSGGNGCTEPREGAQATDTLVHATKAAKLAAEDRDHTAAEATMAAVQEDHAQTTARAKAGYFGYFGAAIYSAFGGAEEEGNKEEQEKKDEVPEDASSSTAAASQSQQRGNPTGARKRLADRKKLRGTD